MLFLSMWLSAAFAQELPAVETAYVQGEAAVSGKRFFDDAESDGGSFGVGQAVRVLVRDGGWTRVRQGNLYLWVPSGSLSTTPPLGASGGLTLPPGLKLPEGFKLPEGLKLKQ